jgi:hypothetical protein
MSVIGNNCASGILYRLPVNIPTDVIGLILEFLMPNEKQGKKKKEKINKDIDAFSREYSPSNNGIRYSHIQQLLGANKKLFRKNLKRSIETLFWPKIKNSKFDITTHLPSVNDGLEYLKEVDYVLYNCCDVFIKRLTKFYKYNVEKMPYCCSVFISSGHVSEYNTIKVADLFSLLFSRRFNYINYKSTFSCDKIRNKLLKLNKQERAIGHTPRNNLMPIQMKTDKLKTLNNNLIDLETQQNSNKVLVELMLIQDLLKHTKLVRNMYRECIPYDGTDISICDKFQKTDKLIKIGIDKETTKTVTMDIEIEGTVSKHRTMKKQLIYDELMKNEITNKFHKDYNVVKKLIDILDVDKNHNLYYTKINIKTFIKTNKLDISTRVFQEANMFIGYNAAECQLFIKKFEWLVDYYKYIETNNVFNFHKYGRYMVE